ncbi:MAG: diphthine synthase [Candidatus Poseidoniaceae archaeon]|nr:diphthine synthase [Candidatus Poseidoniaceae archaeon]
MTLAEEDSGLFLIGTGVGSATNMSLAGVKMASHSTHRFLENYTSMLDQSSLDCLVELVGDITTLQRNDIENPKMLLDLAKTSTVSLLVIGDPLQATTHVDLLLRCHDEKIPIQVIHATSVTTLVTGGLGLQNYRFGRQVTLAFPHGDYLPTSPIELLCESLYLGNHVLVLFDLDPTSSGDVAPQPMTPEQAVLTLEMMAAKLKHDLPPHLDESILDNDDIRGRMKARATNQLLAQPIRDWQGILCTDLGTSSQRLRRGALGKLAELSGGKIHCLVMPAELHDMELEAVEKLILPA